MPQGRLIPTPGTDNVKNCPTNSRIGGGGGGDGHCWNRLIGACM